MAAAIPALTTAAPFITAGTSVLAAQQAGAIGRFNQQVSERNAYIAAQRSRQIYGRIIQGN